jgi:hypothetical protein
VSLRAVAALRHGALAAAQQLAGVEQEDHPLSRESA